MEPMSTPEQRHNHNPLTDEELDAVLFAADREILDYVRHTSNPTDLFRAIMAIDANYASHHLSSECPQPASISRQNHAITIIMTRNLAHDIDHDLDLARELASDIAHTGTQNNDIDLAHILDLALDHTRALARILRRKDADARDLARAFGMVCRLAASLDRERDRARDIKRVRDRAYVFDIARSLPADQVRELLDHLYAIQVYAWDADLSLLDLHDLDVLNGVIWTTGTTWPPGLLVEIYKRSHEIGLGIYKVHGKSSESDCIELAPA
jgi:hypothetical protein